MLTQINVRDFMPFGEAIFLPDSEELLLVMGENGAGKSALFEAVYWSLTGQTVRGMSAANVIRHGEKSCEVTSCWQTDEAQIAITRYKSKSENRVEISIDDGEPETYTGAEAQPYIEEHLGDLSLLSIVAFFGRKFQKFSQMSARDRADLIDVLARASIWEDFRGEAASDVAIYRRDLTEIKADLDDAEGHLESQQQALDEAQANLVEAKSAQKSGLAELRKDEKGFRGELAQVEKELATIEKRSARIQKLGTARDTEAKDYAVQIMDKKVAITAVEVELRHYDLPEESECPTCGQSISKRLRTEIAADRSKVEAELPQLQADLDELITENGKVVDTIRALSEEGRSAAATERTLRRDETQSRESLGGVKRRIERLNNAEDVTRYAERVAVLKGREGVPMWRKKVKDRRASLKTTEHGLACAEFWTTGFKQIRYMAMGRVADLLSTLMSRSVKALGFDVDELTCTIWKEGGRKGTTRPEVGIMVRRGEYEDPIEALSEGETQRVDLACFIAIGQLVHAIEGFDPGFRVLDEPLVGMDDGGKFRTFQLLAETLGGQRFVIDHDGNFQDLFREALIVERNGEDLAELRSL